MNFESMNKKQWRGYGSNSGEREWWGLDKGGNNGKGGANLKETDWESLRRLIETVGSREQILPIWGSQGSPAILSWLCDLAT